MLTSLPIGIYNYELAVVFFFPIIVVEWHDMETLRDAFNNHESMAKLLHV